VYNGGMSVSVLRKYVGECIMVGISKCILVGCQ